MPANPASSTPAAPPEAALLDQAFTALTTYDRGSSRGALVPIDDAVEVATADPTFRAELEKRLAAALEAKPPAPARTYLCRRLARIGSTLCVPALAAGLADAETADAARDALEVIPGPEAGQALRARLDGSSARLKAGVINSLGRRRDGSSVPALAALLQDADPEVAAAAAAALGSIGTPEAARILRRCQADPASKLGRWVADARLICAERLLLDGKRKEAAAVYRELTAAPQPRHVQEAARRGLVQAPADSSAERQ